MKLEILLGLEERTKGLFIAKNKLYNNPITIKTINEAVKNHFEVDTLAEKGKGRKKQPMREIFITLVFDIIGVPPHGVTGRGKTFSIIAGHIGRDRTNINHYANIYEGGFYSMPHRVYNGDYYTNHFYAIKEALTGHKYSEKMKTLDVSPKSWISRVLSAERKDVLEYISSKGGRSFSDINEMFFKYHDGSYFSKTCKRSNPALHRLITYYQNK